MDGGAPAAVSAIENAVGVVVDDIPATPERIHRCWLDRKSRQVRRVAGDDR